MLLTRKFVSYAFTRHISGHCARYVFSRLGTGHHPLMNSYKIIRLGNDKTKALRVWLWIGQGKVKLTLYDNEPVFWGQSSEHDEGYSYEYLTITLPFPTRVGMNRRLIGFGSKLGTVPHTRGDEPAASNNQSSTRPRSPHAWG